MRNVVLVHGGFVDGSGWEGVYRLLTQEGLTVSVVQNPTLTLEDDADATRRVLDRQDGPAILVGHSYGGAVISEAGTHEKVAGLVYVTAFAPDRGKSVNTLIAGFPRTDRNRPSCRRKTASCSSTVQVRRVLRGRRRPRSGRLPGRRAGPVGCRRARWNRDRTLPGATSRPGTSSPPTTA